MLSFPSRATLLALAPLLLLFLAGCSTFESRSREKAAAYATLDEAGRARLQAREIRLGDTSDLVYIALGHPSEKKETTTPAGRTTTWIYTAYWQEYQGTRLVGHRREVFFNPATKTYQVTYVPDYQPIYAERAEDRFRVTFENDRVTVIERLEPAAKPSTPKP
jgi:outer membrane protein assembly factor BamE (lipoprotein component of BamABCDE complex)